MQTAAYGHPPSNPPGLVSEGLNSSTPGTAKPPLRRAVYVHVSDLLSAYNIDRTKLEEELQRVKRNRNLTAGSATAAAGASSSTPESASSTLGVPTELDTNPQPKKLQPPRGGFNLCVLVGKVDLVVDKYRVDGSRVRLAEVEVGDETGRVSLRARDEQIDLLQRVAEQPGAAVVLRNCTLELFQGKHMRLAVTKWGKITPYPDAVASTPVPPTKMNEDRFLSGINLTVVAVDTSVHDAAAQPGGMAPDVGPSGEAYGAEVDSHGFPSRGGRGSGRGNAPGRRQGRQKNPPAQPVAAPAYAGNYPVAYGDVMRYPGGMHGYGYVDNTAMGSYGGYRSRNPESMASAHMMMQQQYEMHHQRQMQQMYQNRTTDATGMLTGLAPSTFDTGFGRNDVFMNPAAHRYPQGTELVQGHPHPPGVGTAASTTTTSSTTSAGTTSTSNQFPSSPRMNPKAATFDPAKGGP